MNTPHERLTRTTFSLPLGEVHALEVVPNLGHFLHVEAPITIAARVARWLA
jgi:pimeloyl-ACP methyl ester carboxylesterase